VCGRPQARLRWPLTVSHFGADSKDLICRYSMCKSGNMAEETQTSFAYDSCDVKQAGTTQDFVIGDEVVPSNVQDAPLAPHMEGVINGSHK